MQWVLMVLGSLGLPCYCYCSSCFKWNVVAVDTQCYSTFEAVMHWGKCLDDRDQWLAWETKQFKHCIIQWNWTRNQTISILSTSYWRSFLQLCLALVPFKFLFSSCGLKQATEPCGKKQSNPVFSYTRVTAQSGASVCAHMFGLHLAAALEVKPQ